jgi:hypothetical protein
MEVKRIMSLAGFNKDTLVLSGEIFETCIVNNGQVRFLIHTGNGSECLALFLSVDEIAGAVTGAVVDKVLEAA